MARAGATVDPTDFAASARILGQVRDWVHPLNSPKSIDKHFGMKGYNKTAASVLVSNCYSEIDSLHDWVRRFVRADQIKPMPDGDWDAAEGALNAAEPYLRTLSGEKRRKDEEMYETTETAGHIKAAAIASAPLVPIALAGGAEVVSAAYAGASALGAEAATLLRLAAYFVRDPRVAVTLLRGQVVLKPDLYYGAFAGLVGATVTVAEVGGPKKFAEMASTPEGAAQLLVQLIIALSTHGTGGPRPKTPQPGKQPSKSPSPKLSDIVDPESTGVPIMTPQQKGLSVEAPLQKRFGFEPVRENFAAIDGIKKIAGQINVVEVVPVDVVQIKRVSWEGGRTDVTAEQIMKKATEALGLSWRKLNGGWRRAKREFNVTEREEGADKFGFELPEKWTDETVTPTIILNVDARPPPDKNVLEAALLEKVKARFGERAELQIVWGSVVPDDSVQAPTNIANSQGQGELRLDD
jgi:hypothetical protein